GTRAKRLRRGCCPALCGPSGGSLLLPLTDGFPVLLGVSTGACGGTRFAPGFTPVTGSFGGRERLPAGPRARFEPTIPTGSQWLVHGFRHPLRLVGCIALLDARRRSVISFFIPAVQGAFSPHLAAPGATLGAFT